MTMTNKFNDGEFQQVCNNISTSVWESYKMTIRIIQLYRNLHSDRTPFLLGLIVGSFIVKISAKLF